MPAWTRFPTRLTLAMACAMGMPAVHAQDRHAAVQAELTALVQAQAGQHQAMTQVRASVQPIGELPWPLLAAGGVLCGLVAWGGWALAGRRRVQRTTVPSVFQSLARSAAPSPPAAAATAEAVRIQPPAAPLARVRTLADLRRPGLSSATPDPLLLPPAERLRSLAALLRQHEMLVAIGQPLRAVRLLQVAASGSQGDCLVPWLALLALRRSLGDAEGFQRDWLALQQRLGPVPAGVLLRQDGESAAVERHPPLAQALVQAWQSDDPAQGLHALLFERSGDTVLSLDACDEILLLAQLLLASGDAQLPLHDLASEPAAADSGSSEVDLDLAAWERSTRARATVREGVEPQLQPVTASRLSLVPGAGAVRPMPAQAATQALFDAAMRGERTRARSGGRMSRH